ncbi:MAG TPA: ABC transporter permease [Ramlibacter sp.]|nr:ABC transporter permease [Ramlibacter sp.]
MGVLVLKRLLGAMPNLLGIVLITFLLTRALPGDPAAFFAGPAGTQEAVEQVREKLGLNRTLPEQFWIYLGQLARGDLGQALSTGLPVRDELLSRLPASLELVLASLVFAIVVALPLGIAAARRPNSWVDHVCRLVTTAGVSLPTFFTGLLLAYVLYFLLGWAPSPIGRLDPYLSAPATVTGFYTIDSLVAGDVKLFVASAKQMILPALTLGIFVLAPIARMTRASMLAVLSADFVRTARASGLSATTVLVRYALRNALLPVVTTMGMVFSFLLGMSVIVEKVFAWPGVGSFALEALVASDYAPVQGFVLTMAVLYTLLNLVIDLLYVVIDPRVRLGT